MLTVDFNYNLDPKKIEKKLRLSEGLYNFAYQVKSHQLAKKNPSLNQNQIHLMTLESFNKGSK